MARQCACLFGLLIEQGVDQEGLLIEWDLDQGAVCIRMNDTGLTAVL